MKKMAALLAAALLLTACGADRTEERVERLQDKYISAEECTAVLTAHIVREEETASYELSITHTREKTRVTVRKPEALAGISAEVGNDEALTLEYDGIVLDAGSVDPAVSGVTAVPLFFRAVEEGYMLEWSAGRWMETENALRLCFELELDGSPLLVAAWFDEEDEPLYAELERNGEIVAYLEFTDYEFGAILAE